MLSLSFQFLAATKDTGYLFDETDSSVGSDFIHFHGRLATVLAGTFDQSIVDNILGNSWNLFCCFEIFWAVDGGAFLARFKRFLDAVRAKQLLAGFVLNWNVGKTRADAASNEVLDVLILQIGYTYEIEAGWVDIVVDFLVDA